MEAQQIKGLETEVGTPGLGGEREQSGPAGMEGGQERGHREMLPGQVLGGLEHQAKEQIM